MPYVPTAEQRASGLTKLLSCAGWSRADPVNSADAFVCHCEFFSLIGLLPA